MNPEHMAAASKLINDAPDGPIVVAELLATQLAEVERLTRELELAGHSLLQGGTEHARDLGHLADRNREIKTLTADYRGAVAEGVAAEVSRDEARELLAERTRERDALADLVGDATVRAALAPGESMVDDPDHALTEAIEQLRRDRGQLTRERDDALAKLAARPIRYIDPNEPCT